jgi:hypothetical protein
VLDRVRVFMRRPLADTDRVRLFGVAVAAIVVGAAVLALIEDPPAREPSRARPPAAASTPAEVTSEPALELPGEEGDPPAAAEASPADVRAAKAAARRFLTGYLPFSYGQAGPRAIDAVSDELRHRLESEPPRVPAAERRRRPRVVLLQAEGVSDVRAAMLALVADGARRYTVRVELARRRSGWRVTNVGS